MLQKHNLASSEKMFESTFNENQIISVRAFIGTLLETEDFTDFSKYTRVLVSEYFKAFLYRLTSLIWMHYSEFEDKVDEFFKPMTGVMARQISGIKKELKDKDLLTDVMSDHQIGVVLTNFFYDYEYRAEFKRIQKEYLIIRQQFNDIVDLTHSFSQCGENLTKSAADLTELYLKYKEAIFKGMGFDVELHYLAIDNFTFTYRDARLQDEAQRKQYERIIMNASLKAAMPGFDGDISVFENLLKDVH